MLFQYFTAPSTFTTLLWTSRDGTDILRINGVLQSGKQLKSQNGRHILAMQTDGNVVFTRDGVKKWESGTSGNIELKMQDFGGGKAYLQTFNVGGGVDRGINQYGAAILVVGDEGAAALYTSFEVTGSAGITYGRLIWSARSDALFMGSYLTAANNEALRSPSNNYFSQVGSDGNFIVWMHSWQGQQLHWMSSSDGADNTGTNGYPHVTILETGLLVARSGSKIHWSKYGAGPYAGHSLRLTDEGKLVFYHSFSLPDSFSGQLWSS